MLKKKINDKIQPKNTSNHLIIISMYFRIDIASKLISTNRFKSNCIYSFLDYYTLLYYIMADKKQETVKKNTNKFDNISLNIISYYDVELASIISNTEKLGKRVLSNGLYINNRTANYHYNGFGL